MTFQPFAIVILNQDVISAGLVAGQAGTVVEVFTKPHEAYLVEFCNEEGETLDTVTLQEDEIELKANASARI